MSRRALIIGSDRDYCYIIKEFLVLRELYVTVVLNYKDGIDRLFYERPDLTILELTARGSVENDLNAIKNSNEFEIIDFTRTEGLEKGTKAVLIFDDKSRINSLFDFLRYNYSNPVTEESPDTEDEGSLGSTFYPSLLVDIHTKKRSGILSITSNTELIIYFINGSPVFAEGGDIQTAIGKILLDSGKINEEIYEKTLDIATKNKQKFGQILFEMGITSPHELNSFLEFQIQEKILSGFYYINGKYVFKSGDEFADRIVSYQVNLSKVIYEGVKRYIDVESLDEKNPVIEIDPKLKSDINSLGLKPKELRFVQLLKERSTVKDVLQTSRLDKPETLKLLYFLSLFKLLNISGISPDAIGRASIEKLIGEKEAAGESKGSQRITSDAENAFSTSEDIQSKYLNLTAQADTGTDDTGKFPFGASKDPAPEARAVRGRDTGSEEFMVNKSADTVEISEVSETAGENRAEGHAQFFEPASGSREEDGNHGVSEETSDLRPHEDDRKERVSYMPETPEAQARSGNQYTASEGSTDNIDFGEQGEGKTSWLTEEDTPGYEIELDSGPEPDEPDTKIDEESAFNPKEQGSGQSESLSPEPELELEGDSARYSTQEHTASGSINDLFQPYTDAVDKKETDTEISETANVKEFELILAEQSPGPANAGDPQNDWIGKTHSAAFNDRVSEFYSTMDEKDYYQILEVTQEAQTEEIRDAYYKLVKFYHPDVNPNADHEIKAKAEEIFTRITTAYETLSESDKRKQYDSHEELAELKTQTKYIYEAEMAFKKGITLLVQRDYVEAEKKIRVAVNMNPGEAAYLGAHAWTRFLAAEDKSAVLEEVKRSLEAALKMNEKIPENYFYLGSVYKFTNDPKKAERYYEKALELAPDYIEAKREIRLINTRKTESKNDKKIEKKFWSSIFKK